MGKQPAEIRGTSADDVLTGTANGESLFGYEGNDQIYGFGGNDTLNGHEGNDSLYGGDGSDTLYGGIGDDRLDGGAGNDSLFAGIGNDVLTGGCGADIFAYTPWFWTDQTDGVTLITDFQSGVDRIDLSRLDANETTAPGIIRGHSTPGNEAFVLVSSTDGVTPGHLVITTGTDAEGRPITIILGYTDTVAGADLEIHLLGVTGIGGPIVTGGDLIF